MPGRERESNSLGRLLYYFHDIGATRSVVAGGRARNRETPPSAD
jgi:hypothetical protein